MSDSTPKPKVGSQRLGALAIAAVAAVAVLGILGLGLLVFSILGLFGLISTPLGPVRQHLSAADLASSAVAGATLMLAVFTAYLAIATRASVAATRREAAIAEQGLAAAQEQARIGAEQVEATNRHAKVAQQTLEASWRPFMVDVPWGYRTRIVPFGRTVDAAEIEGYTDPKQGTTEMEVPLRNIGSGPAVITKAGLSHTQLHADATSLSSAIVASGEVVRVGFSINPDNAERTALCSALAAHQPCVATVFYSDQGGVANWRSRVYLHHPHAAYEVEHVELYAGDEIKPFATTRPQ